MADQLLLMVGTCKGAFLLSSDRTRRRWRVSGPHFPGSQVFHLTCDLRGDSGIDAGHPQVYAAVNHQVWGRQISVTRNLGGRWESLGVPKYPADSGLNVDKVWHLEPGPVSQPGVLYAGVEPAGLFVSRDGGRTWAEVEALNRHPTRAKWQPGGGGLCLHTIVLDTIKPRCMWVAISTGGVFRTDDGGRTWVPTNRGTRAEFLPDKYPEAGQCVHKMARASGQARTLFQQNHCGIYRSDNGGDTWQELTEGLPSTFGFPLATHPRDPNIVYLVPLASDDNRTPPEGRLSIYRTGDGGRTWEALNKGLPRRAYDMVFREGLALDSLEPAGVYVGTQNGNIFASRDEGDSWYTLARHLPPILSVSCTVI